MSACDFMSDLGKSYNVTKAYEQTVVWMNSVEISFLYGRTPNVVYIDSIVAKQPGQKMGTMAIKELTYYADKHNVVLWLEVKPIPHMYGNRPALTEDKLVEIYKRFGFHQISFGNRTELGGFIDMLRQPKSAKTPNF